MKTQTITVTEEQLELARDLERNRLAAACKRAELRPKFPYIDEASDEEVLAFDPTATKAQAPICPSLHTPVQASGNCQTSHSPLPPYVTAEALYKAEKARDTLKLHAQRLADATRQAIEQVRQAHGKLNSDNQHLGTAQRLLCEALAQWEGSKS